MVVLSPDRSRETSGVDCKNKKPVSRLCHGGAIFSLRAQARLCTSPHTSLQAVRMALRCCLAAALLTACAHNEGPSEMGPEISQPHYVAPPPPQAPPENP